MDHETSLVATTLLFLSVAAIVLALPLILRLVKMNGSYGVRIAEAYRSQARWLEINRVGGMLLLLWGVAVGITGVLGIVYQDMPVLKYALVAAGVVLGGVGLVTIGIFVYAAKTKKP
jgi:hypothetical protein